MNRNDAKIIARDISNDDLYRMFENAKTGMTDWTVVSSCNKGFSKGVAWNIFHRAFLDGTNSHLAKENMIREFGEFLPEHLIPAKKAKKPVWPFVTKNLSLRPRQERCQVKPPNNKIQFITTTIVATNKEHKLDPEMVKYCFEIVVGNYCFTTPWYVDKKEVATEKRNKMHAQIGSAIANADLKIELDFSI